MKYNVLLRITKQYEIPEVEADSEEQAIDKAWELMDGNRDKYFDDENGGGCEAFEIEEGE